MGAVVAATPHALGGYLALRRADTTRTATVTAAATAAAAGSLVAASAVAPVAVSPRTALAVTAAAAAAVVGADRYARHRAAVMFRARVVLPPPARPRAPVSPTVAGAGMHAGRGGAPLLAQPGELVVVDVNVPEPSVDVTTWRFQVDGDVPTPLSFTLADLLGWPLEERDMLMVCVHNPVGGSRMGCARWTGISLADLLQRAGVATDDGWLVAEAVDGYSTVVPVQVARQHGFLALGMAGRPLPREHGSPARLLISGRHGQDGGTKWLRRLTLTSAPPRSYWGRRGWVDGAYPVHPGSRIDQPAPHRRLAPGPSSARGYAWAPPDGVDAVQLSVDDGPWTDTDLGADLGPHAWRAWSATWPATPGAHRLRVRCHSRADGWQDPVTTAPYPHGVHGLHDVPVRVGGGPVGPAARVVSAALTTRVRWAACSMAAWRRRATA